MSMQQQLTSAAAIMVGQEVHELNTVLCQCMYTEFTLWKRQEPGVKPRIWGWVMVPTGCHIPVTILVDDGASHCLVNSLVEHEWGLELSGEPGPAGVLLVVGDVVHTMDTPVQVYLALGDTLREAISMSPLALEVGVDLILGWDWIV